MKKGLKGDENLNAAYATYNNFTNLIEFKDDVLYDGKNLKTELIPVLFHEYFHHYMSFNSLFYLEGKLLFYELISQIFDSNAINKLLPIKENYEYWLHRNGLPFTKTDKIAFKDILTVDFDGTDAKLSDNGYKTAQFKITNENHSDNFKLTPYTINESTAHIIESFYVHILNEEYGISLTPASVLPYKIISTYILNKDYNIILSILLCDLSFQSPDPGNYLIKLFSKYETELKDESFVVADKKLLELLKKIYSIEIKSEPIFTYKKIIEETFKKSFKQAIGENPYFNWMYDLHNHLFLNFEKEIIPDYFTTMFHENPKDNFLKGFLLFPVPLIIDKDTLDKSEYILFDYFGSNQEAKAKYISGNLFFRALLKIFQYVDTYNKDFECSTYSYCNHKFKNNECLSKPWLKGKLRETCEFGVAANLFKLNEGSA